MKQPKIIILLFLVFFTDLINGQTDSVKFINSIDSVSGFDQSLKRKQLYLDANFREEKTLFKLGISPLEFLSKNDGKLVSSNINGRISVEQKIVTSLSAILNNNFDYNFEQFGYKWKYSSDIGLRYYYSINKRIKESIGANNFHSNYFSFELQEFISFSQYEQVEDDMRFVPAINLSWGMQRRIGKFAFVDLGPYIRYQKEGSDPKAYSPKSFSLGVNLLFGLGLGK